MSSDVELALLKDSLNAAVAERDAAVNTLTQLQTQSTEVSTQVQHEICLITSSHLSSRL